MKSNIYAKKNWYFFLHKMTSMNYESTAMTFVKTIKNKIEHMVMFYCVITEHRHNTLYHCPF